MKNQICFLLLLVPLLCGVGGAPAQGVDPNLKSFYHEADDEEQMFSYKTNDGQSREETVSWDKDTGKIVISGWYRYLGPDGVLYTVQYVADENGFQPLGAHLPGADPNPDLYAISTPYKTKDNQWRDETVEIDPNTGKLVISGWYRYVGPDGVTYQVKYVADENGYRPLGMHLPGADLSDPNAFSVFTPLVDSGVSRTVLLSLVG
uniref:Uncharacterized protein n=1 Tax=Anopheles melas TaxID=34690 RepID=A0A182TJS3_9DIPT